MQAFFAVVIGSFALGHASPGIQASSVARGAAVAVYNIIDEVPIINSASPDGEKPDSVEGTFRFEDVKFTYPARPDVQVGCAASDRSSEALDYVLIGHYTQVELPGH